MTNLEQRVKILEGRYGAGELGKIAESQVMNATITEDGLLACGDIWERQPGEDDSALRKRVLSVLLQNDRRALIGKC